MNIMKYNQTADRVVLVKTCLVKGKETQRTTTIPTSNQILGIIDWARDAIGPVRVYIDEATIRSDENLQDEQEGGYRQS